MTKRRTSMILFTSISNGFSVFVLLLCLHMIFKAIAMQIFIGESLLLGLFGLAATVALNYFSRIPVLGSNKRDLKKMNPVVPCMHKYRLILHLAALVICIFVIIGIFHSTVLDTEEKQIAREYIKKEADISSTDFFDVLPDVITDNIYVSAILLDFAEDVMEDPSSEVFLEDYSKKEQLYDSVNKSRSIKIGILSVACLISGYIVAILKLRMDYVTVYKKVGD